MVFGEEPRRTSERFPDPFFSPQIKSPTRPSGRIGLKFFDTRYFSYAFIAQAFLAEPDAQSALRKIASNFFMSAFASSFLRRSSSARCSALGTYFLRAVRFVEATPIL